MCSPEKGGAYTPHADIVVLTNIVNVSVTFPRTNSISRREEEVVWFLVQRIQHSWQ